MILLRNKLFSFNSSAPDVIELDNGLTLEKTSPIKFMQWLGGKFKWLGKKQGKCLNYKINLGEKTVGCIQLYEDSSDTVNLAWIDISKDNRGKHYAQTILRYFINSIRKSGYKTITLEVPGNSPDARHIYEKLGFKDTDKTYGSSNDVWNGLTCMKLEL